MSSEIPLQEIRGYLDQYLRLPEIPDEPGAVNGLQMENRGLIGYLIAAVDASQATIDGAVAKARHSIEARAGDVGGGWAPHAAPLLIVHHGLFWDGNLPVTGRRFRRLGALFEGDVALYAAHIPLDVHPEVGNNIALARRLGLAVDGWFGTYKGIPIGVHGRAPANLGTRASLVEALGTQLAVAPGSVHLIPGGPETVSRIGIIAGAAGDMLASAREAGLDTFITGEGAHHTHFDAMEWGINLIYAGHYATESLGVQALAAHLSNRFGLPWEFHHHPTGL